MNPPQEPQPTKTEDDHLIQLYHKDPHDSHHILSPLEEQTSKPAKSFLLSFLKRINFPHIDCFMSKTPFCRHDYGCLENVVSGTLNSLVLSYILSVGINFLSLVPFKRKYNEFIWSLFRFQSLRMCGFITSYTFVLKSTLCLLRKIREKDDHVNNFISGAAAGFLAIGFLEKVSRMTWSGYLLARAFDALYKHLVNRKVFKKREIHYILIFALMYGFYGYCIAIENDVIPRSIAKFFNSVYKSTYEKNRFTLNNVLAEQHAEHLLRAYGKK